MSTLDLQQAQQQLDQLVDAVSAGSESVVVIRDRTGRPAAKLVSVDDMHDQVHELRERLRRLERLWKHAMAASDPRAEARARLKRRVHQGSVVTNIQRDIASDAQREMVAAFERVQHAFAEVLGPPSFYTTLQKAHPMSPPSHASRPRLIGIGAGKRPVPADIDSANPEIQRMFEGDGN